MILKSTGGHGEVCDQQSPSATGATSRHAHISQSISTFSYVAVLSFHN